MGRDVGMGAGVLVARDASVVATAASMGTVGVAVLPGKEHDAKTNMKTITIKKYLMR